jgi:phage baseplate assembly protein W
MYEIHTLRSKSGDYYGDFSDIDISSDTYDMVLVSDKQKIQQQICTFLLTEVGSVPLFPNFGTKISTLLNNRTNEDVVSEIKNEIESGLKYIKSMNEANNDTLNIDKVASINLELISDTELSITLGIILTDGNYLQIEEKAMGRK